MQGYGIYCNLRKKICSREDTTMTPTIYMLLFCAALVTTYLAVRLGWVRTYSAFVVGAMVNSLLFFLYSVARDNSLVHALTVGIMLGMIFTGLSVTLGSMFRSYAPDHASVKVPSRADAIKA
jgi:uncharacterized membrane protein